MGQTWDNLNSKEDSKPNGLSKYREAEYAKKITNFVVMNADIDEVLKKIQEASSKGLFEIKYNKPLSEIQYKKLKMGGYDIHLYSKDQIKIRWE